ncbi:MAG TPA: hypothetical protein VF527_01320 [Pyrinomonadaceae bacterium]|jgi:hypothetical protein
MRWIIAGGALIVAVFIIYEAFELGPNSGSGALLLNLGTEVLGITLTVAIVEYLLEKRAHRDEARRIAWNVLHDIDHTIWVWQGGGREFDVEELTSLLDEISDGDPLPPFTQNLIMNMGSRSENTLRQRDDIMKVCPELKHALQELSPLSRVRNKTQPDMTANQIAEHLKTAVEQLVKATEMVRSTRKIDDLNRNPSIEMQEWRHYGEPLPPPKEISTHPS